MTYNTMAKVSETPGQRPIVIAGHLAALFSILVWGVTFVSTKILLQDFSPLEILFMRFLLGWLALFAMCPKWLAPQGLRMEFIFACAGLSGVTLYFLFENVALTYSLASNVGVIVTASPLFTALLAWIFLKEIKPGLCFLAGFGLAMCGISLMTFNGARLQISPLGDFLALLAALAWSVYTLLTRRLAAHGYGSIIATRRIFFYGLVFMLPLMAIEGFSVSIQELAKPANYGNLLFLGLGASALCFATWTFSIRQLGAVRTSVYIYLVPLVTVVAAAIVLHENLSFLSFAGMFMTITGLILAEKGSIARIQKDC